jgi:hypothetical protein
VWAVYYERVDVCGVVYYIQIRKSEQRPPLHLRTADHVPQPRTPRRGGGGGGVYSYSADIIEGPRAPAAGVCSWASRSRETMNMTEQETRGTKQGRHKTGQRRANYPHHSPYLPHSESRAAARLTNKLLLLLLDFSRVDGGKKK